MRWTRMLMVAAALGCADATVDDGVTVFLDDSGVPPVAGGEAPDAPGGPDEPHRSPDDPNPGPDGPNSGPDDPDPGPDDPGPGPDDPGCPRGGVVGLACAPDGSPIAGARVYAETTDCDGGDVTVEVAARGDGGFTLEGLAPGPITVVIEAGRFVGRYDLVIEAGHRVQLDERSDKECLPTDAAEIAVTTGDFDSIENIVSRLGFERDVYCADAFGNYGARGLLGDWAVLSRYDVVMINCGLTVDFGAPGSRVMVENLRRFVQGGGSVYISDLAGSVIEAAWPDKVQFDSERLPAFPAGDCCECVDCPAHCGANLEAPRLGGQCMGTLANGGDLFCIGEPTFVGREDPGHVRATIRNEALRRALGRDNLEIEFESGGWVSILRTAPDVEVLVEANGMPLLVQFEDPSSGGRVTFTTFHNEAQVAADVEQILRALVFQL